MTLYQFIALDDTAQAEAVWSGTLLGMREAARHRVLLYAIDDFYVEVYYHPHHNTIQRLRPFKQLELLEPYLQQIDISELLSTK